MSPILTILICVIAAPVLVCVLSGILWSVVAIANWAYLLALHRTSSTNIALVCGIVGAVQAVAIYTGAAFIGLEIARSG